MPEEMQSWQSGPDLSKPPTVQSRRRQSIGLIEGQKVSSKSSKESFHEERNNLSIRDRLHHFTLAWFTCTMSTGGITLLLSNTPHQFRGLTVIGDIIYILDIFLFLLFTALLITRFTLFPGTFRNCLSHPTESLFVPTFFISVVNILSNAQLRGVPKCGPWLPVALRMLFWIYTAITFSIAVGQYFFLFTGKPFTLQNMTPQWILPIFPVMLSGTLASVIGGSQPPSQALPILIAGVSFQGLGMLISTFMYGPYLARLMTSGLPSPDTRPGMFIAVGPPSFTGLALLGISTHLSSIYPSYTISSISNPTLIPDMFRIIALSTALFLWATALWFFSISLVSVLHGALIQPGMSFHMVWWAFVFPNVGFAICSIRIGDALESQGVLWVGSAMTILLVSMWLFVGVSHIRAVWKKQILWPGMDEDRDQ